MTPIERAETEAKRVLNGWLDAMVPKFNPIEIQALKQRLTAAFRTYEERLEEECRINGMGQERELRLMALVQELETLLADERST